MAAKLNWFFIFYSAVVLLFIAGLRLQSADYRQVFQNILREPYRDRLLEIQKVPDDFTAPQFLYRGDLQRTGVDRHAKVSVPVAVTWKVSNLNIGVHTASKSSPSVDYSGIYVGSDSNWFSAFDFDGKLKWRYRVSQTSQGVHGTAALDRDFVYFSAYNGRLYKALKKTGQLVWTTQLADAIGSSILLQDQFVYVSCETNQPRNGYLAKLNRDTGEVLWRTGWLGEQVHSSPTLSSDGSLVFIGDNKGQLNAFRSADGQFEWVFASTAPIKGTAVAYGNLVAFTSWSGFLYALDQTTGRLVWKDPLKFPSQSSPSYLKEKNLLIVSASSSDGKSGAVVAVRADTGLELWRHETSARLISSALISQDVKTSTWTAWTTCEQNSLCAYNAESGLVLQRIDLGAHLTGMPTAYGSSLYVGLDEGPLIRLSSTSDVSATGSR